MPERCKEDGLRSPVGRGTESADPFPLELSGHQLGEEGSPEAVKVRVRGELARLDILTLEGASQLTTINILHIHTLQVGGGAAAQFNQ